MKAKLSVKLNKNSFKKSVDHDSTYSTINSPNIQKGLTNTHKLKYNKETDC